MKKLTLIAMVGIMGSVGVMGQSNAPVATAGPLVNVSVLAGNLPPLDTNTTLFSDGKLELRVGVIQQGATGTSYESQAALSYFFTSELAVTGDCVNGGANSVDAVHLGLEFAYPMRGVRLGAFIMGGRNFAGDTWEGKAGVRLSYVPLSNVAPNTFLFVENFFLVNGKSNFKGSQPLGLAGGIGYRF